MSGLNPTERIAESPRMSAAHAICHVCRHGRVEPIAGFSGLRRVTSDCRPWRAGGSIGVCGSCATVQKLIDQAWRDEASQIYGQYQPYYQSRSAVDQVVFDQDSGLAKPRSQRILEAVRSFSDFAPAGRMLDVGCGTGAMLRAFSDLMPQWELNGLEPNLTNREALLSIPGMKQAFECPLVEAPGSFDVISMIHVLEHVEDPLQFLRHAAEKLRPQGHLLIEVPFFPDNPYDLAVADHCTHFTVATLAPLLAAAGLEPVAMRTDVVAKEITALARRSSARPEATLAGVRSEQAAGTLRAAQTAVDWLQQVAGSARAVAELGHFGLFGTSISANWLFGELQEQIRFFVDEDPQRIGTTYYDRPVIHPADVATGSHVFMNLPHALAARIAARLQRPGVQFHLPPPYQNRFEDAAAPRTTPLK